MQAPLTQNKNQRVEFWANEYQKNLIEKAATLLNMTVSQYVISIATSAAKATLDDHAKYKVDEENWDRVMSAIDNPHKSNGVLTPAIQSLREMGKL